MHLVLVKVYNLVNHIKETFMWVAPTLGNRLIHSGKYI